MTRADPSGLCWICGIGNAIGSAFRVGVGLVKQTVSKAASWVKQAAKTVVKKVSQVAAKVVKEAVKVAKKVHKVVSTAARTFKAAVKHTVTQVKAKAKQTVKQARRAADEVGRQVSATIKRAGDTLNEYGDAIQTGLDVVGLIPVVGEVADGANALIYAAKGDYAMAALSAAAMIPVGGQTATIAKFGIKGLNYAKKTTNTASKANYLFRGVADTHPGYADALNGVARPRGGPASAIEHNLGDTKSEFTSWTTDPAVAKQFAGQNGVVLRIPESSVSGRLVQSPDLFHESEVLVRGVVSGAGP